MASKIYVENLPSDISEERLMEIFTQIGEVQSVKIKPYLVGWRSKSHGVIEMSLDLDAYRAVNCFEGATIKDRKIHVKEAMPLLDLAKSVWSQGFLPAGLGFSWHKERHDH